MVGKKQNRGRKQMEGSSRIERKKEWVERSRIMRDWRKLNQLNY
jgi:hypothetical protein